MTDSVLSRVQILLEANTAKFETGMAKAGKFANDTARTMVKGFGSISSEVNDTQKQVNTLSQTFEKHDAEVKKIAKAYDVASIAVKSLSAMAAGVSIASLTSFANQYMEKANDIQKYAKLVGSSTQQFQYYAAGAEAAGVSMEKFADIGKDALDKLGDAKAGQGELMDFFNQLGPKIGVTIAQFKDLSGPEVIQKYYNGLKAANVSHAETVKFMEQIANDGSLLIPLLENGGQGFKKWGDAAKQANAIMSDEMIANLLIARENVKLLTLQWEGFQASLVNEIVPAVKILKDHTGELQAAGIALGTYVGGALVIAIGKSTIAGYAKVKQIIEQISVQSTAIQLERAAAIQELQTAQAKLASVESTMVALQAERALEIQRLKAQISAQGLAASQTRLAEISVIEAQVKTELTAANTALATSQTRVTAAQTASLGIGRGLLAVLGGPAGLAIFAASVAASFLLMKDNSDTAKDALEDQGLTVDELRKKYSKLNAEQLKLKSLEAADAIAKQNQIISSSFIALKQYVSDLTAQGETAQAKALQQYLSDLQAGGDKAKNAFSNLEKQNVINPSGIKMVAELGVSVSQARTEIDRQNQIQDIARKTTDKTVESQKKQITVLNETAKVLGLNIEQWGKLTATQQDYAKKVASDVGRQAYIAQNMKGGKMTREQAEFMAAQHESMGVSFYTKFNQSQQQIANKAWAVTDNFTLTSEQRRAFSKVQQNAAKYNFSDKESFYGLPSGLLSAIMMNESRGDTYRNGKLLTSESGAQGSFQFLPGTAKRFGVDVTSVESSAAGAAKYLQYLYKRFGDWDSAIAAYHAGEGNVEKGTNIGSRTRNYVLNANKYVAAANGKSTVDTSLTSPSQAEALAQQAAAAEATKAQQDKELEIRKKYYTQEQQLAQDNADAIKEINSTLTGSAQTDALAKQAELYKSQLQTLHAQEKEEYNQLHAFETDRITQLKNEYDVKKQLVDADLTKSKAEREDAKSALDRQMQAEIDAVQRQEAQQILSARQGYDDTIEIMKKRYALERDEIAKNTQMTKAARDAWLQAIDLTYQHEIKNAELEKEARLLAAQEGLLTESTMVVARYQLEREQLKNITGVSKEEIDARLAYQELAQQKSLKKLVEDNQKAYREAYNSALGLPTNQFDVNHQTVKDLQKGSNELRDSQLASSNNAQRNLTTDLNVQYSQGLISEQDYQQKLTDIVQQGETERAQVRADAAQREQDIQNVSKQLQLQTELSYGEQITGSMVDMLKSAGDEQSGIYKTMFVAQKAFAIAQSMVAIQTGIAQAAANPFPANLAAMASVAAATASIISNISSVAGVFHGGTDYVPKESSYLLDKGERVLSPRQNQDLTSYLAGKRDSSGQGGSGTNITINNNSGAQVNAQQNSDGSITIDVVDQMIKRSWQQLNNANSRESKSLARNTTARRNR
ncbi:transglycosylase SLT domain-containing protein [Acinetobacter sp. ANC 4641]|uniref:transglycosylase SLT domain-containing protein n=1 Tax=Acinetobacter sp. ANC 4641 TaxID=2529847 RepID=UPI0013F177DE|nr:transglycosylase SLT domain-containing protein [Acinetobacter sp. ANC 4641]